MNARARTHARTHTDSHTHDKTFVATEMILVAAPANDSISLLYWLVTAGSWNVTLFVRHRSCPGTQL